MNNGIKEFSYIYFVIIEKSLFACFAYFVIEIFMIAVGFTIMIFSVEVLELLLYCKYQHLVLCRHYKINLILSNEYVSFSMQRFLILTVCSLLYFVAYN